MCDSDGEIFVCAYGGGAGGRGGVKGIQKIMKEYVVRKTQRQKKDSKRIKGSVEYLRNNILPK